jgi:transposase
MIESKGKMILELIEVTGFSRTTISTLIRRYNTEGVDACRQSAAVQWRRTCPQ